MRNFIRTSHDQRRRSSAAATAEQLAYLSALSEHRGQPLPAVESAKLAADIRRSSMGGEVGGGAKGPVAQLLAGGSSGGGVGGQDRRRGSLTGSASAGALGVGCGGVLGVSSPMMQSSPRRRWNADRKDRLNKLDACDMEIRQTSVLAIVLIVCAGCMAVVLLAYALKSYL